MIPLYKPFMPSQITAGVEEILYSGQLTYGKWSKTFEENLGQYVRTPNVIAVNSYFSAFSIALSAIGVVNGDEIIASPMSCLASNQPLVVKGAKVIWADIDPSTGTLCPESVRAKITPKTKLICHNHHAGYIGHIQEINTIGKEQGIFVLDDCIEGFGGDYLGNKLGNCGTDISVISFQAIRLPNTMEGGAIIFKDATLLEKAKRMRDLGVDRNTFRDHNGEISALCDITEEGYQANMCNLNAYIGNMQLPLMDELIAKHRNNAQVWDEYFLDLPQEYTPLSLQMNHRNPNYWVYGVLCENKIKAMHEFRAKGFYASGVHLPNNHYSLFGAQGDFPGVSEFYCKFLALPAGWWFLLDPKMVKEWR